MIYIYGDSHANLSFKNLNINNKNYHQNNVTMFRIGRDNIIINFNKDQVIKENNIIILDYGEIDCRCHIQRQINIGNNEDDVINDIVNKYFITINNNINKEEIIINNLKIIIIGIIPPTKQNDYENIHGPITNEYPFIGKDEDRVRYTNKMNKLLEELSKENNYIYFNPYKYYTREDGTLKYELSDITVHLGDNSYFLEKFIGLYENIYK